MWERHGRRLSWRRCYRLIHPSRDGAHYRVHVRAASVGGLLHCPSSCLISESSISASAKISSSSSRFLIGWRGGFLFGSGGEGLISPSFTLGGRLGIPPPPTA